MISDEKQRPQWGCRSCVIVREVWRRGEGWGWEVGIRELCPSGTLPFRYVALRNFALQVLCPSLNLRGRYFALISEGQSSYPSYLVKGKVPEGQSSEGQRT